MTLMLIDDDEDDRIMFIDTVDDIDHGIHCITVEDGQLALQWLKDEKHDLPDYIFLDIRMPRIGGKKCLEEIKKDSRLKNIPVIVYTTSANETDSKEFQQAGAIHFITKPTDPAEIYYILYTVIHEKWQ